eukprot:COSAG02_NODE_26356_length_635_cov_0.574627_1_plen_108_part_01
MAQCIRSLRPGTSRKARVETLDRLAGAGERAGPEGVGLLIEQQGCVWEALLEQCLDKELLVRVYALRALRKMALDASLAAQLFEHYSIVPTMRLFDTPAISLTFPTRM